MFSDTHFHLAHLPERGIDCAALFRALAARNCRFALDIGNTHDDLPARIRLVSDCIEMLDAEDSAKITAMLRFSGGMWPSPESFLNRAEYIESLKANILAAAHIAAVGECGLDHHQEGAENFDSAMLHAESELFEMQLALARDLDLPIVVHSRDAFDGTLSCIKNTGYHRGIIHCFSYGIAEARQFLNLGWYISFAGAITYTKKAKLDDMKALLKFVPRDRLLIETDSPYLTPVPFRGQTNTPNFVEYVYRFAADLTGRNAEDISADVDANVDALFFGKARIA